MARDGDDRDDRDDNRDEGLDSQPTVPTVPFPSSSRTGQPTSATTPRPDENSTSIIPSPLATAAPSIYYIPITIPPMPYTTLSDGSLLTSLYTEDLAISNVRLFGGSALLTLFIINVWIATTFLRRAQLSFIKDKTLFYLFLASQVMGPVAFASLLAPFFSRSADCTVYVKYSSKLTESIDKHSSQRQHDCIHRY